MNFSAFLPSQAMEEVYNPVKFLTEISMQGNCTAYLHLHTSASEMETHFQRVKIMTIIDYQFWQ